MTPNAYQRDVLALLRDDYGVTDTNLSHGGNHPRVTFTYDGTPRQVTLNNKAYSPRALDMKRQDLRRLLGDPPPRPTRVRRTMEEMMSGFNPLPLQALATSEVSQEEHYRGILETRDALNNISPITVFSQGRLAIYADRLRFEVPAAAANAFDVTEITLSGIDIVMIDSETWKISRRGWKRPSLHYSRASKRFEIDYLNPAARDTTAARCGLSPAEYRVEGDVIMVRCPYATRVGLASNSGKQKTHRRRKTTVELSAIDVLGDAVQPAPSDLAGEADTQPWKSQDQIARDYADNIADFSKATEIEVRACLDALRRIEATTPYRLGRRKETGAWCFSAPRIE